MVKKCNYELTDRLCQVLNGVEVSGVRFNKIRARQYVQFREVLENQ